MWEEFAQFLRSQRAAPTVQLGASPSASSLKALASTLPLKSGASKGPAIAEINTTPHGVSFSRCNFLYTLN